jgi:hypothetical protein
MRIGILQSNYIPWIGYLEIIRNVDLFVLYEDVQYTKNDWRNRNQIIDKNNNKIWMTIPIIRESSKQRFTETTIDKNAWAWNHFNLLLHNFSKENNWKLLANEIEDLYQRSKNEYLLLSVNRLFLKWLLEKFNIDTPIIYLDKYINFENPNDRLISILEKYKCSTYLSGPSAINYLDQKKFLSKNILIEYVNYEQILKKFIFNGSYKELQFSSMQFLLQGKFRC